MRVINHNFNGVKSGDSIRINGSYDVNIWYSYDNDTKTQVIKETNNYSEVVRLIKELLNTRIRPRIKADGGDILYQSFDETSGEVKVKVVQSIENDRIDDRCL